jgi:hypothetical protein
MMSDLIDFFMVSNVIDVLNWLFEIKVFLRKVVWAILQHASHLGYDAIHIVLLSEGVCVA